MDLRSRLQKALTTSGESARAVSALAGLSPTHLGLILSGQREQVAASTLVDLAEVLGCTVGWLIAGEGPAPDPEAVRAAVAAARARRAAAQSAEAVAATGTEG